MSQSLTPQPVGDRWISARPTGQQPGSAHLICLPYAGGGRSTYRSWPPTLAGLAVLPVQLPGREERDSEPPYCAMPPLVSAVADALTPCLDSPYALFGHSLGARIAFELARELRRRDAPAPALLCISSCKAPHIPRIPTPPVSTLPDKLFGHLLRRMNGTPPEVLDDPELMRTVLPTLRADFMLVDSYTYTDEPALDVPISVFGGTDDPEVREDDLLAWQAHTTSTYRLRMLPGGHFIVHTARRALTAAISEDLAAARAGGPP